MTNNVNKSPIFKDSNKKFKKKERTKIRCYQSLTALSCSSPSAWNSKFLLEVSMACGAGGSIFSVSLSVWLSFGMSGQALNNEWRRDIMLGSTWSTWVGCQRYAKRLHTFQFANWLFFLDFRLVQLRTNKESCFKNLIDQIMMLPLITNHMTT